MAGKAKTLTERQLNELLESVTLSSHDWLRDHAIILLSFKGGLRAQEIAGLSWRDVCDARGNIGKLMEKLTDDEPDEHYFDVPKRIAKKGHDRKVPLHPRLKVVLEQLRDRDALDGKPFGNVIKGAPVGVGGGNYRKSTISPNALQRYLSRLYRSHGFDCTSHSGRRTLITRAARIANEHDCSLFDVQRIAGHKNIETTEAYVDLSPKVGKLMRNL